MNTGSYYLLILAVLIQFAGVFDHSLWTPDEPKVAEIAREMSVTGNYLIPDFSGRVFLEKPPLYYAGTALFYRIFGTDFAGAGRIASVIFAIGTLLVLFCSTARLYSRTVAGTSALVLASTLRFFDASHKMIVDMGLVFFITLALFSFILAYKDDFKHGYKLFWISLCLAFMTKGLVGIAIPCAGLLIFMLWQRDLSLIKRAWGIPGIMILVSVMGLWAMILYLKGGTAYLDTFYIYNQFGRFFNAGDYTGGHIRHSCYYFATFWGDAAPWSLLFPAALISLRNLDDRDRFLYSWFFGGFALLSIASTKRGLYLLPLLPAMAVILSKWFDEILSMGAGNWGRLFLAATMILIGLISVLTPFVFALIGGQWWLALVMLTVTLCSCIWVLSSGRALEPGTILIVWALLLIVWVPMVFPRIDSLKDYRPFFHGMGRIISPGDIVKGYKLTETVEALSLFYGGFAVDNIEDKQLVEDLILYNKADYLIIIPERMDKDLLALVRSRGECLLKEGRPDKDTDHSYPGNMFFIDEMIAGKRDQLKTLIRTKRHMEFWCMKKHCRLKGAS